jgi:hypothetical protein
VRYLIINALLLFSTISRCDTFTNETLVNFIKSKETLTNIDWRFSDSEIELENNVKTLENLPLLKNDAEILLGIYQKIFRKNKKRVSLARMAALFLMHPSFQDYYFDLWSDVNTEFSERIKYYDQNEKDLLKKLIKENDLFYVDGHLMAESDVERLPKLPHQWLFFSNKYYPVIALGSLDLFVANLEAKKAFSGACGDELQLFKNLDSLRMIYLDSSCATVVLKSQKNDKIKEPARDWLLPAGLLLGALALNALKDKKIVIKTPAFNF